MPILNYTTKIDVRKTAAEIQDILADAGAQSVHIEYQERIPVAISFRMDLQDRPVAFRLPSRWQGVYKLLNKDSRVERRFKSEEQARRVAWRIIKDWVEAQLAIVQAGTADLAEVFLPYAINPTTGNTLYQEFTSGHLLGPGSADEAVDGEWKPV